MVTIFTPTYNREQKLLNLYNSLKMQTCYEFEWVVVDDGSTDNTRDLILKFKNITKEFNIKYIYKENGGKHTAYNLGLENASKDLFICVDSDDFLDRNAIKKIKKASKYIGDLDAGIIALKQSYKGELLSNELPSNLSRIKMYELKSKYNCTGEFSLIFITNIAKKYKFPIITKEKFITESVIYDRIDKNYFMKTLNEIITICEYLPDGYSYNINKIMKENPSGYCLYFMQRIDIATSFIERIIYIGKYHAFKLLSKGKDLNYKGSYKMSVLLLTPLGILFYIYYKLIRKL